MYDFLMPYGPLSVTDGSEALYIPFHDPSYGSNPATYISKDRNATSWARTNGTWGKYGITLAGADYLKYTVANWRSGDSTGTLLVWFKISVAGVTRDFLSSSDEGANASYIKFGISSANKLLIVQENNADPYDAVSGGTTVTDGNFHLAAYISNGTAWSIFLGEVLETLTPTGAGNTGDWFSDTTLRDNVTIGVRQSNSYQNYYNGVIGEVYYTPLVYTQGDVARYMQRTQWRYKS